MRHPPDSSHRDLVAVGAALLLAGFGLVAARALAETPPARWLGPDGEPLPFRDDAEVLAFLGEARVTSSKQLSSGSNHPYKLSLELDGVRAHAIFRDVDKARRGSHSAAERLFPSYRDSYLFEVAAYEMSRLLGLDNVPPARLYRWNGRNGSIQLWVEEARSEGERMRLGERPAHPATWHLQRTTMRVFDNLIYNFDRNHGNQLLDETGKLWFVDHTRTFKPTPRLPSKEEILIIDESLWRRLRELDDDQIRARLEPYLDARQLDALIDRHRLLVAHVESLIEQRGEEQVLLHGRADPAPPAT